MRACGGGEAATAPSRAPPPAAHVPCTALCCMGVAARALERANDLSTSECGGARVARAADQRHVVGRARRAGRQLVAKWCRGGCKDSRRAACCSVGAATHFSSVPPQLGWRAMRGPTWGVEGWEEAGWAGCHRAEGSRGAAAPGWEGGAGACELSPGGEQAAVERAAVGWQWEGAAGARAATERAAASWQWEGAAGARAAGETEAAGSTWARGWRRGGASSRADRCGAGGISGSGRVESLTRGGMHCLRA